MAHILGHFEHSLDAKGRLIIPAKLRAQLGEPFIATISLDPCLALYPLSEWDRFVDDKINSIPEFEEDAASMRRLFGSYAQVCELDSQGRVLLSPVLREYAGLVKDVVTVGAFNKAEVWDRRSYLDAGKQIGTPEWRSRVRAKFGL